METIPRALASWLSSNNVLHPSEQMTIANSSLKQFEQYKSEQQQNDQHMVKDQGRTVAYTGTLVAGKVQTSAIKTEMTTWKHSQADTSRTAPFEKYTV